MTCVNARQVTRRQLRHRNRNAQGEDRSWPAPCVPSTSAVLNRSDIARQIKSSFLHRVGKETRAAGAPHDQTIAPSTGSRPKAQSVASFQPAAISVVPPAEVGRDKAADLGSSNTPRMRSSRGTLRNRSERRIKIYQAECALTRNFLIRMAPRPGLEPGTCGLTVRAKITDKYARPKCFRPKAR